MITLAIVPREHAEASSLAGEILMLDTVNMAPVLAALGIEMPIERRRSAFQLPGTIVVARDDTGLLAGYLEYGPGRENPDETYISAIQIAPRYQGGGLLLRLIRHALRICALEPGTVITTDVQRNNERAVRLIERVGFEIEEESQRHGTVSARMLFPPIWTRFKPGR